MSIARRDAKNAKVLKDLNLLASCARFVIIKVLSDLDNASDRVSIDIKVLTDLKRHRLEETVFAMVGAVFSCACMACARGICFLRALFLSEAGWPGLSGWPG